MKLSQFRGSDIRKMLIVILIIIAAIVAAVLIAFFVGRKYLGERVKETVATAQEAREQAKAQEEEARAQEEAEQAALDQAELEAQQQAEAQAALEAERSAIHNYELIVSDCTWQEAYDSCQNKGGYLATIDTPEEFDYILSMINDQGLSDKIFYLGGSRGDGETYYWIDRDGTYYGDALNGNNDVWLSSVWLSGEPSFYDGDVSENVLAMFYYKNDGRWVLNDDPDDVLAVVPYYSGRMAYICEYR